MKTRFRIWPVVTGVLTILVVLLAVRIVRSRAQKAGEFDPALVAKVQRGDLEIAVTELGRIEPREKAGVKSRVAGQVSELLTDEGQMVKKGQLLMVLDPIDFQRDVTRAVQEVQKADAALEFAKLTLDRRQKGLAERAVAQADVEFAENDLKTKKILLNQARESLAVAQDRLRFSRITAPIDGTVTQRNIRVGETVVPGSMATFDGAALLTLSDLTTLIAKADLNQIDVARVQVGQDVTLTLDALPGKTFKAKVSKIAPASMLPKGKDIEVFPIEATLLPEGIGVIKPGMTADVKIHIETKRNVLRLPIEAVTKEKGKSYVQRINPTATNKKDQTTQIEVQTGARSERELEILSGIDEGQKVLIKPPSAEANEFK